jgi:hypothetical protein
MPASTFGGHGEGVAVPGEAVLRLRVGASAPRLLLLLEGEGTITYPGGEEPVAPALILPLAAPEGEVRLTLRRAAPLRLHALQWVAVTSSTVASRCWSWPRPRDAYPPRATAGAGSPSPAAPLPGGWPAGWRRRLG